MLRAIFITWTTLHVSSNKTYKEREARRKIISVFFRQVAHFSDDERAPALAPAMQTSFWLNFLR
jgi:hypothetical protein